MTDLRENLSSAIVTVTQSELRTMVRLVRLLDKLSRDPAYRQRIYQEVPSVATFDPRHDSVMMCYDFHLTESGPKLIEVNTNAGGGLLAYLAYDPCLPITAGSLKPRLKDRLLQTFAHEIQQFSGGSKQKPEHVVIVDEDPPEQYLYPEMCVFAELFRAWGVPAEIADPGQLEASAEGVWSADQAVDLVYNRHCDFYLERDAMSGLRDAYLSRKVCLSPNPHLYGLLADKRRFVLWSDPTAMESFPLSAVDRTLLENTLSRASLLADLDLSQVWATRKQYVFKPVDSFGSRGVLLGEKISRRRFAELPVRTTLVQDLVPPSITEAPGQEPMKTDLRLYAYRDQVLGVTARLYRGQVTNLRTPGGGFARIRVIQS